MTTINISTRRILTWMFRRRLACLYALTSLLSGAVVVCSLTSLLSTFIANHHLIAQVFPDLLVQFDETWLEADLRCMTRARQIDSINPLDGTRSCRNDAYPVSQRNRLLQIMGHEDNRGF